MKIPIIYEDENIVVINKPSGLVVHGDGKTEMETLVDWIQEKYPETKGVGESIELKSGEKILRPGIVHRLDKDTSGVLLIAKNQESYLSLKEQFKNGEVNKMYKAIVYGIIKQPVGVIDKPIGRSSNDFRLRSTKKTARGVVRESKTEYQIASTSDLYSLVNVYPKTGRTHQIRVHFQSIGHPVVCDTLYAPRHERPNNFSRLGLHAFSIDAKSLAGEPMSFEAPLPDDMQKAIQVFFD